MRVMNVYARSCQTEHMVCVCFLCAPQCEVSMNQTAKIDSGDATGTAALTQDSVPLSEMDKAAVLTLIREEVQYITSINPIYSFR